MLVWVFKGSKSSCGKGEKDNPGPRKEPAERRWGQGQASPCVSTENKHVADGLRLASEEPWVPAVIPELACIQEPLDILRQGN